MEKFQEQMIEHAQRKQICTNMSVYLSTAGRPFPLGFPLGHIFPTI